MGFCATFHSTTIFLCIRADSVTISWTPDSFQLPKRDTPNKWTLFSDNRSKQDTKKTWQLNCDEHMAEYFHTIQELLILEENSILLPAHLACLLRVKENWWDRLPGERSIWVVWDRKQWRGQKKLSLPMKEGKRENTTDQINIGEQDQSVPSG